MRVCFSFSLASLRCLRSFFCSCAHLYTSQTLYWAQQRVWWLPLA